MSKERKRRYSNSQWVCLVNNLGSYLKDKSFLHLDWLDHSSIAMCRLSLPGQDTISWHLWRCLWRKCQIIQSYWCLNIFRKHFLWTKWESRKMSPLYKGSQSSKTTLCHRISKIYRSHLAVINLSESRSWFRIILLKIHLIKMFKQENTFEAIVDSLDSSGVHLLTSMFFQAFCSTG